jgi:hypothetical protein
MKEKLNDQEDTEDTERKRGIRQDGREERSTSVHVLSLRPFRKAKDEVQVPQG